MNAHLVFLHESSFLLIPNVRRTWAPRGHTPVIYHRCRREKISAISAVSVSSQRQRLELYVHFHRENITQTEVAIFLRDLLRHLRGPLFSFGMGVPFIKARKWNAFYASILIHRSN